MRLILIAEDDAINREVILQQVELLGYAAEIANDGAAALLLWRAGRYALLLSDLDMPEMDGYSLAAAIRREEAERGLPSQGRIPILAFTANALRGEASRARAAGMDEYLTKPLKLDLLKDALAKWLPREHGETMPAELTEVPGGALETPAVDVAVLKGMVGDDPETVREFLSDYRDSTRQLATEIGAARAAGDMRQIGAIVHKLKSSSRSVGALALGDLCAALENDCRAGELDAVLRGLARFDAALLAVGARIGQLLERP